MCGIVALYAADRRPIDESVLLAMRDSIAHRGPDDAGHFLDRGIGLGHRRLSIIDLSTGHQPMSDPEGRVWIVFNGEIYNYQELRSRLADKGYRFRTTSDTEVIIAAYLLEGDGFVELLNGIFALALWDAANQRLLIVRDRMGVKPLYFWSENGLIAAASEVKALLQHPEITPELATELVPEYLAFRQLAGNRTLFRKIRCLGPAEILVAEGRDVTIRKYWNLPRCVDDGDASADQLADELEGLLVDACRLQLMSDVPLGTYNSGGVDSSLVTGLVSLERREPLNTFCVGLREVGFDERPYAELVADRYGTHHHAYLLDNQQFADVLPRVIWHYDEPLNHPNTVPMYLLSREAKKKVTVVLTGEGSDELFAGYPRYRIGAGLEALGRTGRLLLRPIASLLSDFASGRLRRAVSALRVDPIQAIMEAPRYVSDRELHGVLSGDLVTLWPERRPAGPVNGSLLARMLEQDQRNYLLSLLSRLDKASMAFGVEARVPILDHRIVEFAARVPPKLKLCRGETKHLVKKVALRRLPREVVTRRKSGLALPLREWFRDQQGLGRYLPLLMERRTLERGLLEPSGVEALVGGGGAGDPSRIDLLWALVNLELWQRELVDAPRRR